MTDIRFSNHEVVSLIILTLTGIVLSVLLHIPLVLGFTPGLTFLFFLSKKKYIHIKILTNAGKKGLLKTKNVIWILCCIGLILPAWSLSGTIFQMVQLALVSINAQYYIVLCFLMSLGLSMILGTSIGTISVLGIPLINTAQILGLPLEMVAGALISGALVGDRTSPLSSSHQLLAHTLEIKVKQQFIRIIPTGSAAILISTVFFTFLDQYKYNGPQTINLLPEESILVSATPFIPVIVLILLVIFKFKIRYAFLGSIISASVISFIKGITFSTWLNSLLFGIKGTGGLQSMFLLICFVAVASAYNQIIEDLNLIQPLMDKWLKNTYSLFLNTLKTVVVTIMISLIACNQILPIILTGRLFLAHWRKYYDAPELSRVLADSSMLLPALIPWNMLAILCSQILGVSVLSYLPYAIFLWILPVITLLFSGLRAKRIVKRCFSHQA
ncbi:MAG: sodium:proton antiporter [Firmicutes bacterium]|nr:sodium:proton antiporter [Bacillota bacterium]